MLSSLTLQGLPPRSLPRGLVACGKLRVDLTIRDALGCEDSLTKWLMLPLPDSPRRLQLRYSPFPTDNTGVVNFIHAVRTVSEIGSMLIGSVRFSHELKCCSLGV